MCSPSQSWVRQLKFGSPTQNSPNFSPSRLSPKEITLLVGISASGQSLQPCFVLKHFPRGFSKFEFEIENVDDDIKSMQHKSKSFRLYINRKTDWVTSVTWTHFMKSLQEENEKQSKNCLIICDDAPCHSDPNLDRAKIHFLLPNTTSTVQPCDQLYISQIKRKYKNWLNDQMDGDSIPDMSRSIRKIVKIISEIDENIILQSWVRAGLTGESEEIHLGEDEHDESGVD